MNAQFQIPALQITLDAHLAQVERERALLQVEQNAAPDWKTVALACVKRVAAGQREFTTDDVLELLRAETVATHEMRALGPVMRRAADLGYIVATDRFITSASVSRHRAPTRVWSSQICGQ